MRERTAEISRTFSVYLPNSLYQKLVDRAGKGKINTFIKEVLEKELVAENEKLILAHQRVAKNQKLKKELEVWDEAVDDYINKENGKNNKLPKRGEIWLVKFRKSKETPKTFRPCLVISGDIQNELNDLIAVVPITTEDVENVGPFEVFIQNTLETGLKYPSKVQFIFPMTIDKELRLVDKQRLGIVNKEVMEKSKLAWKVAFEVEKW